MFSIRNAWRLLRSFGLAKGGNVAITFALATLPVIGVVGAAVDFSHANSVKAAMQSALDSTALMLAREASADSTADLQADALKYFKAVFTRPEAKNIVITASYTTTGGSQVLVSGTATVDTSLMAIAGYTKMPINGSSTAKWGSTRLRVALVLDNTGSMADSGKMPALQTATKNLLTQLKNAASQNGDVYVSIVPFVKDVNVGSSNYAATWIDWTAWNAANPSNSGSSMSGSICYNGTLWVVNGSSFSNGGSCSGASTGICYNGTLWNFNGAQLVNGGSCSSSSTNHSTWNGCVTDRGTATGPSSGNYDTNVVAPTTSIAATLFAAEQYDACPQAIMPLSYDWTSMTTLVNNMTPNGNTNQAIGLAMGWMSLVGGGPFPTPPAMDVNFTYQQVIILLTDGLNTQDRWYSDQASIDARQQLTCNNIKAAGVTLYTIQVNTGGDPTSTLLRNCASSSDKFFLLTSASEIVTTFNAIGTNLSKLRVAK